MMKKIIAVLICAVMVLSFIPVTVNAADGAEFKLCVVSQDEKSVTVTLDFAGGTGFCALDANVKYNNLKLSLENCQFASGFASFKNYLEGQGGMTIFNANSDNDPIKISIATTIPFQKVNNDGAIIKLKFSKIAGVNLTKEDISVSFDNCQNADFQDIKTSVSFDLESGSSSSSSDTTVEGGKLPEESVGQSTTAPSGAEGQSDVSAQVQTNAVDNTLVAKGNDKTEKNEAEEEVTVEDTGISGTGKTVAVIIIAVILVACVVVLASAFKKNKKATSNDD
ncbi:MAG: hypothetical protein MJ120_01940 [Clostridia bacterium]|nr:hypothetical protein [Clostridia bacterium]